MDKHELDGKSILFKTKRGYLYLLNKYGQLMIMDTALGTWAYAPPPKEEPITLGTIDGLCLHIAKQLQEKDDE